MLDLTAGEHSVYLKIKRNIRPRIGIPNKILEITSFGSLILN